MSEYTIIDKFKFNNYPGNKASLIDTDLDLYFKNGEKTPRL